MRMTSNKVKRGNQSVLIPRWHIWQRFWSTLPKMFQLEFPGGPAVRIQRFHCHGLSSIYCWKTKLKLCVVVQSLSHVWLFAIPWTAACQTTLFFTISQNLFKLMPIESMMSSIHLILCHPLLLLPLSLSQDHH